MNRLDIFTKSLLSELEKNKSRPRLRRRGTLLKKFDAKSDRPIRNGVAMRTKGGKCREVWDWCDIYYRDHGRSPTGREVKCVAEERGWNHITANISMYQWRKFHQIGSPSV